MRACNIRCITLAEAASLHPFTYRQLILHVLDSKGSPITLNNAAELLKEGWGLQELDPMLDKLFISRLRRALASLYSHGYVDRTSRNPAITDPLYPQAYLWSITGKGVVRLRSENQRDAPQTAF
jgi:hypothetical protein